MQVRRGQACALDFSWFASQFPKEELTVISKAQFRTPSVQGMTFEEFFSMTI